MLNLHPNILCNIYIFLFYAIKLLVRNEISLIFLIGMESYNGTRMSLLLKIITENAAQIGFHVTMDFS